MLAWIGGISYGLYLIHYPVLRLAAFFCSDLLHGLLLGIFGSLVLAWVAEAAGDRLKRVLLAVRGPKAILETRTNKSGQLPPARF